MAQLSKNFDFTGSLGNVSAYKMRGSDKIILRTKGGASKNKIKTHPRFKTLRKHNAEFGGRSLGSKWIRLMLQPLASMGDYNTAGPINALIKPIQAFDTVHELGERDIFFSKGSALLHGFSLNKRYTFDSIIRSSLVYSVDKASLSGSIDIPELVPGINFFNPGKHNFYSIVAVLGVVPDLYYSPYRYMPAWPESSEYQPVYEASTWFTSLEGSKPFTLSLKYNQPIQTPNFIAMLSVGIKFGTMGPGGVMQQIAHAGGAKILVTA
jgi:hypothetical protein